VSDVQSAAETPIKINQQANIHVTELAPGATVSFQLAEGRQAYLLCMEGSVQVDGAHGTAVLDHHDAAEVFGSNALVVKTFASGPVAHLLLVEMAFTGPGRTDL
jgi:quercetin 2,3-dioxygenase